MSPALFPKTMRVCSPLEVSRIFSTGTSIRTPLLRAVYLEKADQAEDRIVVSVPKRLFKRAVKRNLLKRRIREAYRLHRHPKQEGACGKDIVFVYTSKELADYETIKASICTLLDQLA